MQKITLTGRLGRDAAVRETQDGGKMVSFTVAVNGVFRGVEKTYWYDVVSFNYSRYKNMVKYLTKGSSVAVTGDLDADIEEGKDGEYRCRRNVTADAIEFGLSSASGSTASDTTVEERPRRSRRRDEEEPDDISDEDLEVSTKPRKRSRSEEDEEPETRRPARRQREEEEEEETRPARKSRKSEDEDEPKAKAKSRRDTEPDDDEEEVPRSRRKAESDDDEEEDLPF